MLETTGKPLMDQKLLFGAAAAGMVATALTGVADRVLDHLVSDEQKRRDHMVRKGTAHQMAGPYFAEKLSGKDLGEKGEKRARAAFSIAYSLVWGTIYAAARKRYPFFGRFAGLPFAVPFFFACDGLLAPLLGVSPKLTKVPWQPSAKELANHVAWTAAAEMIHRAAAKSPKHA